MGQLCALRRLTVHFSEWSIFSTRSQPALISSRVDMLCRWGPKFGVGIGSDMLANCILCLAFVGLAYLSELL